MHPSKLHRWSVRNEGVAGLGDLLCLALQVVNDLNAGLDCTREAHDGWRGVVEVYMERMIQALTIGRHAASRAARP